MCCCRSVVCLSSQNVSLLKAPLSPDVPISQHLHALPAEHPLGKPFEVLQLIALDDLLKFVQ